MKFKWAISCLFPKYFGFPNGSCAQNAGGIAVADQCRNLCSYPCRTWSRKYRISKIPGECLFWPPMQFWYFHHLQRVRLSIANRLHGPIPISFCFGENFQQNFHLQKKNQKSLFFQKQTTSIFLPEFRWQEQTVVPGRIANRKITFDYNFGFASHPSSLVFIVIFLRCVNSYMLCVFNCVFCCAACCYFQILWSQLHILFGCIISTSFGC